MGEKAQKNRFKSLGVRAISGVAMLFICGVPIYLGGGSFFWLLIVMSLMMMREWVRMCNGGRPHALNYLIAGLSVVAALVLGAGGQWKLALAMIPISIVLMSLLNVRTRNAGLLAFGTGYILASCLAILWLRNLSGVHDEKMSAGLSVVIFILVSVIAADSFAYLGGSLIKGPKLAPKISPNKTWAGFFCGVISAGLIGGALGTVFDIPFIQGLGLGSAIAIISVFGDILESATKRYMKVKDTGAILPGHGGILDRVDSVMLAALVAAIVLYFMPSIWPPLVGA